MKRYVLLGLMGLALSATPAMAQVSVYGGGGAAFPTGDDMEDVESGLQLLGGIVLDLTDRLSIYGEGQWGTHDVDASDSDIDVTPSALMAGLMLGLSGNADGPVMPYAFGGLGLQSLKIADDDSTEEYDDRTFAWHAGAGLGFELLGIGSFLEGRYQSATFDADSDIGTVNDGQELTFAIFSIIFGFSFDIGGN